MTQNFKDVIDFVSWEHW